MYSEIKFSEHAGKEAIDIVTNIIENGWRIRL